MSKKFSPAFKAEALRLLAVGVTTRDAQSQLKRRFKRDVGEGTLRVWAKAADTAPASAPPPHSEPEAPAPDEPADEEVPAGSVDAYDRVVAQIARAQKRAAAAEADGNHAAAQRFSKQEVDYTLLLARLEKDRKADTDVVTIPRAELERAGKAMRDRVAAIRADHDRTGGLTCSNCGREIRIALARGDRKDPSK